eukprot:gene3052-3817_t
MMFRYFKAILWFVLSLVISCGNDGLTKYLGNSAGLHPWQITFFRFAFGILTLLPIMLYKGRAAFITQRWKLHGVRGIFLFAAIGLWSLGVQVAPMTTATLMSFTVPLFVLLLAAVFLKEKITWPMQLATWGGFLGILIIVQPNAKNLNQGTLLFVFAAVLFSVLDILNKKYVTQEPLLCMLFYSTLVALALVAVPALQVGKMPIGNDWLWLGALGIGNNLILYCILRAFALSEASALAPFRYIELLFSMLVGYVCFGELPAMYSYLGACIKLVGVWEVEHYPVYLTSDYVPK